MTQWPSTNDVTVVYLCRHNDVVMTSLWRTDDTMVYLWRADDVIFYVTDSGTIDFNEFLQMMARKVTVNADTELKEVFTVFDINGDGYISSDELHEILSRLGETVTKVSTLYSYYS